MDDLTTTQGIVALGAAGVGALDLILALGLAFKLRRLRSAQKAVLGPDGQRDLVTHAQQLEKGFTDLRDWVEESIEHFERRMQATEARLGGCVAYRSLVLSDAYNELSGPRGGPPPSPARSPCPPRASPASWCRRSCTATRRASTSSSSTRARPRSSSRR